jgi:transmembrane sensor
MQGTDHLEDIVSSGSDARLRKEAVAWVIRLQNADVPQEERLAFDAWQTRSSPHRLMFQEVLAVWNSPELHAAAMMAVKPAPVFSTAKSVQRHRWSILAAACVALLVIAADFLDLATRWQADYRTGAGERRAVELPDRSIATLNTQSAIALSFDGTVRRVRLLSGEAFFNVRHDAARPFVVESTEATVRAVGTAFVVRAEAGGDRVTVLEGTVEVNTHTRAVPDSAAVVTAGSQIKMGNGRMGQPYHVNVQSASAWLRGRLVVQGVPFAQVIEELQRYHPGSIVLLNQQVSQIAVTGTYNVDDPVGALALLVKTVPVSTISLADRLVILF